MTDEQIIKALATKVMGCKPSYCEDLSCACGALQFWRNPNIKEDGLSKDWNPLIDPAASKQVREKLAERFPTTRLDCDTNFSDQRFRFELYEHPENMSWAHAAEADTEERAVALAALLSVGVEV